MTDNHINITIDDKKFVAFKLKIDNVEYPIYQLYISKGSLSYRKYFTINIQENPYNINGAFRLFLISCK